VRESFPEQKKYGKQTKYLGVSTTRSHGLSLGYIFDPSIKPYNKNSEHIQVISKMPTALSQYQLAVQQFTGTNLYIVGTDVTISNRGHGSRGPVE